MFRDSLYHYPVLKYPDVKYTIAGLFQFVDLISDVKKMVEKKFSITLPIYSIYGSPNILWNGGRLLLTQKKLNRKEIEEEFYKLKNLGIIPSLTFTNSELKEKDLYDNDSNLVLELLNKYNGIAIISSELLYFYVKEKYPKLRICSSIIKVTYDKPTFKEEYYNKMTEKFDKVVLAPDSAFDLKLLKKIDKEKIEILVNEKCMKNCLMRKNHYECISKEQRDLCKNKYKDNRFLDECNYVPLIKQKELNKRNITLTIEEYSELYSIGFRSFKVQGRSDNLYTYFFDLLRFILDDKIAFPLAYSITCEIIDCYNKENLNGKSG